MPRQSICPATNCIGNPLLAARSQARPSAKLSLEDYQQIIWFDAVTRRDQYLCDCCIAVSPDVSLHFHRLDANQRASTGHLLAGIYGHRSYRTGHWRGNVSGIALVGLGMDLARGSHARFRNPHGSGLAVEFEEQPDIALFVNLRTAGEAHHQGFPLVDLQCYLVPFVKSVEKHWGGQYRHVAVMVH